MLMLQTLLTLISALRPQTLALLPLNLPLSTSSLLLPVHKPENWPSYLTPAFPSHQMKKFQYFSLYMKNICSFLEGLYSVRPPVCPSVCMPVHRSVCLSVRLFVVRPYVCISFIYVNFFFIP